MTYQAVIGLEIHVQLKTKSKIFSGASTSFGNEPNTQACAVDLGLPGVLPVLNKEAVMMAIKFGLAVNAQIQNNSIFARKNYFYPDLPKGYQISQFEIPIVSKGSLKIRVGDDFKEIRITRAHLEEDAGKSIHDMFNNDSAIDLNRAGTPLIEIVSEPDMTSADEAVEYLRTIHTLVKYLDICDGNMQEGSFRCDANISLKKSTDTKLGIRAEIKNINSFKFVEQAINYEIERQSEILDSGGEVVQETRLYDPAKNQTRSMRSKEEANDYRYFPDPDLLPVYIDDQDIKSIKSTMPELPEEKRIRFMRDYSLSEYDTSVLISDKNLSSYFESVIKSKKLEPKNVANWILTDLLGLANKNRTAINELPITPDRLEQLLIFVHDGIISNKQGKAVLEKMWDTSKTPKEIIDSEGISQESNENEINKLVDKVLENHYKSVEEYMKGKDKLFGFFIGEVMKESKGKANPKIVNKILRERLKK
ncbi:MAG: Asp-tRNA(Asn)/Glu-tRNA(Gln) amidotransferase GatCAB subunit B [Gammaproteobacteria bacterium]|jgi:aspartyl-tRNA(Asn)/glutamyl-tRNA(Gln) amidotransferase subunit B|nr:Asp-tRNA(Asn)/Glu-tRNA(Gln) amidotransferase GatCAB subunit B [Gammaproteobacteria bacterium]|tara:strand:- start:1000 stop:2433 length:1434 start_codon:yes stop_codon:yes gene_type:complete